MNRAERRRTRRRRNPEALAAELEAAVARAWEHGWQPADLLHALRRQLTGDQLDLLRAAIAADSIRYAELGRRVAPGWMAQLDSIGAVPWWDRARTFVDELGVDRVEPSVPLLRLLLHGLPRLHPLTPPPSSWHEGMATQSSSSEGVPEGLLAKVRALLTKAESTSFDGEAEAFTAKAQELMTRHRIDRAMLVDRNPIGAAEGPAGRRVLIDDPYAGAKFVLLDAVARANTVRAIWSKGFDFATVMGFPTDLDVVEELFTSLLVQATSAMAREGSKVDAHGRSRTRRFRRTFLLAYAARIGQRLEEAAAATVHGAEEHYGAALVPVLAARDDQVQRATEEAFPRLGTIQLEASDAEGWRAGTTHADLADLSAGAPLRR